MTRSIGFFTSCPQAEALVLLFGDRDLDQLPQIDQAALVAILGSFIYQCTAHQTILPLDDVARDAIHTDDDMTTSRIQQVIAILEGISKEDAINIIGFLVQ